MKYLSHTDSNNSELRVILAEPYTDIKAIKRAFGLDLRWFFFGNRNYRTAGIAIGALKQSMRKTTFAKGNKPILGAVIYLTSIGYEVQICFPEEAK